MTFIRRAKESSRGQALIEFALLIPIILLIVMVLLDFGLAIDRRQVLQHAVREGARTGAVAADISEITTATVNQSQGLLEPADVTVCYVDMNGNGIAGNAGDSVRVRATYTYESAIGGELLSAFGLGTISVGINPSADMYLENGVSNAPECPP